jgi:maltooligosyltrehalose synthase
LFSFGEYIPLNVTGRAADHVVSFARRLDHEFAITAVPRHFYSIMRSSDARMPENGPPAAEWDDTAIILPEDFPSKWLCELSGRTVKTIGANDQRAFAASELFKVFPVALLRPASA